jgi:DNA-binding winged helix-turn-helix (wHTH) protein
MTMNTYAEPALSPENPPRGTTSADAALEFGRFRVRLRERQLIADGVPIELGTRAFDLLLVLLEADGSLVTKDELMRRVWPGIVVADENLKVQILALRKALGEDRDFIRTEFGRGYRFTGAVRSTVASSDCRRPTRRKHQSTRRSVRQRISRPLPRLVCPEITLADALILLTRKAPRSVRLAGRSEYAAPANRTSALNGA